MCLRFPFLNVFLLDFFRIKRGPLIRLISQDYKGHVNFIRRRDKVLLPFLKVLIAFLGGHVIYENAAINAAVESST